MEFMPTTMRENRCTGHYCLAVKESRALTILEALAALD
jgi:hypothetical protein